MAEYLRLGNAFGDAATVRGLPIGVTSPFHQLPSAAGPFREMSVMAFYEKVIKVKADVAAYLN
jgi:hypothetical protein